MALQSPCMHRTPLRLHIFVVTVGHGNAMSLTTPSDIPVAACVCSAGVMALYILTLVDWDPLCPGNPTGPVLQLDFQLGHKFSAPAAPATALLMSSLTTCFPGLQVLPLSATRRQTSLPLSQALQTHQCPTRQRTEVIWQPADHCRRGPCMASCPTSSSSAVDDEDVDGQQCCC